MIFFCLNQDFCKIYKINRISLNLGNSENLMKIVVQTICGGWSICV